MKLIVTYEVSGRDAKYLKVFRMVKTATVRERLKAALGNGKITANAQLSDEEIRLRLKLVSTEIAGE